MNDKDTTIEQLKAAMAEFVDERDWSQFHSGKNLAMAISVEAAELMEKFIWIENSESAGIMEKDRQEVSFELVDIIGACLAFANKYDIDIATTFKKKMALNKKKYPAEKARGRHDKYTYYQED